MDKQIVILDGFVANSGDLSWAPLANLGELIVYERTEPKDVVERAKDAFAVFTNKVVITDTMMEQLPKLKFIGVLATGYNNVDTAAASRHGITVCNVPAYSTESVVQTVFALLLELTNRVGLYSESVADGAWGRCEDFSYRLSPITELAGHTMGIMGFGNIGQRVAAVALAFGMNVITNSARECIPEVIAAPEKIRRVDTDTLFAESDVLSLNTALTPATALIVNERTLKLMKPDALLINTARGGLVDEPALATALTCGKLRGAGIDVLAEEPPRHGSPLIGLANCVITPHIAWQSTEARERLIAISAANLNAFISGEPQNEVN